jgi:hypothetical protein
MFPSSLESLLCFRNLLTELAAHTFRGCEELTVLSLFGNMISLIEAEALPAAARNASTLPMVTLAMGGTVP